MDKILQNNEEIASEAENLNENNGVDPILDIEKKEPGTPDASDSLDNLLWFDAQVLASSSDGIADNNIIEFAERSENQQNESSLVAIDEHRTTSKVVKEFEKAPDDVVDEGSDILTPGVEQQDEHMNSSLTSAQNKRILNLESELSELKRMLEIQTEVYNGSKKMGLLGLGVAILALIMSFWVGSLNLGIEESGEQQKLVMAVADHIVVPVIDQNNHKIDDLQIGVKALESDIQSPEKTLILPEDDISGVKVDDEIVKLKEDIKAPVEEWVVNLNSYQQRREMDNKMEELKKKGIPTEMVVVNVKGKQWFRIRLTGFKTKAEADSNAAKIKQTLNDDHAWVSII